MNIKQFILGLLVMVNAQLMVAQIDTTKLTTMNVAEDVANPVVLVLHTLGDVHVKGRDVNKIFVYAQEMLPSLTDLMNQNKKEQVFTYLDKHSRLPITVKRNSSFSIQQRDSIYQIETNVFSFNTNIFVMIPKRSSVSVNIKDLGSVEVENIEGSVEANTHTGNLSFKDVDGSISASTIHGNIVSDLRKKPRKKPLYLSTLIGNIEIIVPKSTQSSVVVKSEMGTLYSNFNEVNQLAKLQASNSNLRNRRINFELNKGGTEFEVTVFKGDIYLRHLEDAM